MKPVVLEVRRDLIVVVKPAQARKLLEVVGKTDRRPVPAVSK
jgi:hypothetical protein